MGETKNLYNKEAAEKIKEIAEKVNICLFCTNLQDKPFDTRPMGTQDVDEAGNLWFISSKTSNKDQEIKQDDKVQLIYADNGSSTYLSVYGSADVFYDRAKVEELWTPIAKAWFTEGKDDPNISIIRVQPQEAYYWDTKHGKMVSFLKIIAAAVSGKSMDDGIEGKMEL